MESVCLGQTTGSIIVTSEDPGRRLAAILTANVGGQSQLAGTDEDGTQADLLVRSKSWLGADHAACASSAPLARGSITSRIRGRGLRSWLGINDDAAGKGESQATRTERSDIRGAGMLVRQETVVLRRRLTAVMLADVVNYSRMMSRSEEETHTRFAGHARELIDPTINKYGGRLVRSMGDGLLVEFVSAVDAVRCALDIQRGLAARQANEPDRMQLRIGINTGDVLVDQRDIYGNSVNIAARLEAFASPGTVCVGQSIYDQTRAQPEFFFADRGVHRVKNIPYPIHVYEVGDEPIRATLLPWLFAHWVRLAAAASIGAIAIASIASVLMFRQQHQVVARTNTIVVLPFKNVDGNTTDDYLADAITDELTSELSRLRRAWVIASGTAFTYKDKPNDPRQIGRELHVRYALGGSVRRTGPVVQVNAQLIDTESGINLWANSFAYETSSLIDLQDNFMGRIATSLDDEVTRAGVRHEVGTLAADGNPLDERMRAMAANTGFPTPQKSLETRQHAETGLKADPDNARLLGLLANVLSSDVLNALEWRRQA